MVITNSGNNDALHHLKDLSDIDTEFQPRLAGAMFRQPALVERDAKPYDRLYLDINDLDIPAMAAHWTFIPETCLRTQS